MKPNRIEQLAKQAGMVQGPWANSVKERIWQENRDFPDALEVFAKLIAEECIDLIKKEIEAQNAQLILSNMHGLNQAIFVIKEHFAVDK